MTARKSFKDLTDLDDLGITGNVKQVMQVCYKAHYQAGSIIKGDIETAPPFRYANMVETFNENGYHIEKLEYNRYGNKKQSFYNNRRAIKTVSFEEKNVITQVTNSIYDDKGNYIEGLTLNPDGTILYRHVHVYDSNNHKLSEHFYRGDEQTLINYTLYTYNDEGNMVSYIQYNADDTIKYRVTKKYDDKGNVIEDVSEWLEPFMAKQSKRSVYKNNQYGDCIAVTVYNMDGTLKDSYTFSPEYDSEGKRILKDTTDFELYPLAAGETEEMEYDEHNNWIKKTVYYKNIPRFIVIREIVYADDPAEKILTHPLENLPAKEEEVESSYKQEELTIEEARFLAESNTQADQFPLVRYYTLMYKEFPSIDTYNGVNIEVEYLLKRLKTEAGAQILHTYGSSYNGYTPTLLRYTLTFPYTFGYMLYVHNIVSAYADELIIPSYISSSLLNQTVMVGQVMLLKPSETFGHRDEYFEQEIVRHLESAMLDKQPEKPVINIIEVSGNNFVIEEHAVDNDFEIKDLDINYGYGFRKFHDQLLQRFATATKGLVLFHGEPGTGKTYYIRHLLRTMVASKKEVIYMPPNMADHLADPAFMTFLMQTVKERSANGNFCVLLIEDAEPLLARRQEGVRIQGITNLLNMSDGILNDLLNLQIICTFNVSVKKLDSALLRPGRLIARKEFKPLSVIDANRLAQRIGVKHHFTAPATLGEIYAMQQNSNTLLHDVDYNENASPRIDDLV